MTLARRAAGTLLVLTAVSLLLSGIRISAVYIVPRVGPFAWVIVAMIAVFGLMVVAPLLSQGLVLMRPEWAEPQVQQRATAPMIAPNWPEELQTLEDRRLRDAAQPGRAPAAPMLAERYGLRPTPLAAVAAATLLLAVLGLLLIPMN